MSGRHVTVLECELSWVHLHRAKLCGQHTCLCGKYVHGQGHVLIPVNGCLTRTLVRDSAINVAPVWLVLSADGRDSRRISTLFYSMFRVRRSDSSLTECLVDPRSMHPLLIVECPSTTGLQCVPPMIDGIASCGPQVSPCPHRPFHTLLRSKHSQPRLVRRLGCSQDPALGVLESGIVVGG